MGGAYLEADLDTDLWMEVPAEFAIDGCTVVKLIKSIYGLKQSGELWNNKVNDIFTDMNFVRCPEDPCVYSRTNDSTGERTYICLYVDDILVTGNSLNVILEFEAKLASYVQKLKVCGECVKFLGNVFTRDRLNRTITITQTQYLQDVCSAEGITPDHAKISPALVSRNLYKAKTGGEGPIRGLVGKLRYAVDHSRPDALFIVSQLASHQVNPGPDHILAAEHVTSYFYGTRHLGLKLGGFDPIILEAFCDSSYVEDAESLSQLAYCLRLGKTSGMFITKSNKSRHVSLSSEDAEIRAVVECIKDVVWSRNMLEFLSYDQVGCTNIYEDNSACISVCTTLNKTYPKSKHMNKLINFVREFIRLEIISLVKIHTKLNISDIMTKTLDTKTFLYLRPLLLGN